VVRVGLWSSRWDKSMNNIGNCTHTPRHSPLTTHYSLFTIHRARGQALVEYAIVFPIQLMLTLAVIQLAHLFVAKQVLEYAAFCGARAAVVGEDPKRAACVPISSIAGTSGVTISSTIDIPGWGTLPRSGAAEEKTDVEIRWIMPSGSPAIRCDITHDYELRVPVGNYVAYQLGSVFLAADELERIGDVPHIKMKASCALARPWEE